MKLFDTETNGFLDEVTTIHCLVIKDVETGLITRYSGTGEYSVEQGLKYLMRTAQTGEPICGHNAIKFDIPVIKKLYPWFDVPEIAVWDTLVLSRLIFSDMGERDTKLIALNKREERRHVQTENTETGVWEDIPDQFVVTQEEYTRFPGKLWGRHSLKAWGWRLGCLKGTFAEDSAAEDAWAVFTPEMLDYCEQDVEVLHLLYTHLTSAEYSQKAILLEHQVAWICARMERSGWPFNEKEAAMLQAQLAQERDEIRVKMLEEFKPVILERVSEKTGKKLKDKVIEFNPASRKMIGERLIAKYDWVPKDFTDSGQPQIDEEILGKLPYPEAKILARYFTLEKRLGQLAEGNQAWLKLVKEGHIHGSINTNGAVTGRCTHSAPNIAQVPSVRALWGKECRSFFGVRKGFKQVGVDLSGLELRCLAHFMHQWDSGEYTETVLNGDVHTKNQVAAGLPTRDTAKTFIYAFLYGAGDEKIGSVVGKGRTVGKKLKEVFLKQTPALAKLKAAVTQAAKRGHLIGIDGRKLPIRSEHAALNTLLQSAGALVSKRWVIEVVDACERGGLKYGWDGDYTLLGYVHDELQFAVREGLEDDFGKMVTECATRAGEFFNFKCRIDAEYKIGNNWYDTH